MRTKLLFLPLMLLMLAACEQTPDTDKLDNDYLVYTNYDKGTDYNLIENFYVIDSILLINDQNTPKYWNDAASQKIIAEFANNLDAYGYNRVDTPDEADAIMQLSYVSSTYYYYDYVNGNPWWGSYPGYWNWNSYGWYYPFFVPYTFSTGSIICELIDMRERAVDTNKYPVVWNAYICGLLNGNSLSMSKTLDGINQAFKQSKYLLRE